MSNKIDQLFKRTFQKEQFEYKDSYFEALVEGGLPIRKSFFTRNKWLLLTVVPLLLIGTSTMAYIGYQKIIADKDGVPTEQPPAQLIAQSNKQLAAELTESHLTSPTQNSFTARKTNTLLEEQESSPSDHGLQSIQPGAVLQKDERRLMASDEGNKSAYLTTALSTAPNHLKSTEARTTSSAANASVNYTPRSNTTTAALNSTASDPNKTSKENQSLETSTVSGALATKDASEVPSNTAETAGLSSTKMTSDDQRGSNLASASPLENDIPESQQEGSNSLEVETSLSLSQQEGANELTEDHEMPENNSVANEDPNLEVRTALSASSTQIESTHNEEPTSAEATEMAMEELVDSSNVSLVDSIENAQNSTKEEQMLTIHPAETHKSSWFVGLSTDYNFFSKNAIGEDPFKKYMRLRIAGESPNNNFSYGLYAKRSGNHLSYTAGLQLGNLTEDIAYKGTRYEYKVEEIFNFYGDTLNTTPGEDPNGSELIVVSRILDSTIIGQKDTILSSHTNRINYLQIPLTVGYHRQMGRFTAEVQGGINLMYAYSIDGYYLHESREFSNPLNEHFSRFSMSPMLGLEVNYQLNNNWMLGSRMSYRIPNARFSPDTRFTWKQTSLGVNLSYRFR